MTHLLIDGYNLLHALQTEIEFGSLEERRDSLCELLSQYQRQRSSESKQSLEITIVFDSSVPGSLGSRTKWGNLLLIFTAAPESADEQIAHLCQQAPGKYVVVTSDREVQFHAEANRCPVVRSEEFSLKLLSAQQQASRDPYEEDKEDDVILYPKISTKKKGAARKLPKKERQKNRFLKDL